MSTVHYENPEEIVLELAVPGGAAVRFLARVTMQARTRPVQWAQWDDRIRDHVFEGHAYRLRLDPRQTSEFLGALLAAMNRTGLLPAARPETTILPNVSVRLTEEALARGDVSERGRGAGLAADAVGVVQGRVYPGMTAPEVNVRWPDGTTSGHHPDELEIVEVPSEARHGRHPGPGYSDPGRPHMPDLLDAIVRAWDNGIRLPTSMREDYSINDYGRSRVPRDPDARPDTLYGVPIEFDRGGLPSDRLQAAVNRFARYLESVDRSEQLRALARVPVPSLLASAIQRARQNLRRRPNHDAPPPNVGHIEGFEETADFTVGTLREMEQRLAARIAPDIIVGPSLYESIQAALNADPDNPPAIDPDAGLRPLGTDEFEPSYLPDPDEDEPTP